MSYLYPTKQISWVYNYCFFQNRLNAVFDTMIARARTGPKKKEALQEIIQQVFRNSPHFCLIEEPQYGTGLVQDDTWITARTTASGMTTHLPKHEKLEANKYITTAHAGNINDILKRTPKLIEYAKMRSVLGKVVNRESEININLVNDKKSRNGGKTFN